MNALTISTPVDAIENVGLRTVKLSTLRHADADTELFIELHDEVGTIRRILDVDFTTDAAIKNWTPNVDGAWITVEGRGKMFVTTHTMKGPKFPIVRLVTERGGKNVRMTTFTTEGTVIGATAKKMAEKPKVLTEADFPKPVKADFETFGEWMSACKARKQAMREAGIEA